MWSPRPIQYHFLALAKCAAAVAALLMVVSVGEAQTAPTPKPSESAGGEDSPDAAHFLAAIGKLNQKFQNEKKLPPPRTESRLLPLLPPSTVGFVAIANYGDLARQALEFLDQELKEDAELRAWWNHGEMVALGPKIKDGLQGFYGLNQFLGEEVIVSASLDTKDPTFFAVAETRKPGLKKFLSDLIEQYGGEKKAGVHVIDQQELATMLAVLKPGQLLVLVRPDFVVASEDLATLRSLNAKLNQKASAGILTTPFGKRAVKEYEGGLSFLAAADLQTILSKSPSKVKEDDGLEKSGFRDVKYFIWEHKQLGSKAISQSELSFTGPRHGSAAWLAKPGPLPSLDFVSPDAIVAGAFKLTNPAQVFQEVQTMFPPGPSSPFASLPQAEKALGLSVNDDLLSLLGGELAFELDSIAPPNPSWKAMFSVKDAAHLQKTFTTLLALGQIKSEQSEEGRITYYALQIPSGPKPYEIDYAFLDGYLIAGTSHTAVAEAAKLHSSGGSLAKSAKFRTALPPGRSSEASMLFYDDPVAVAKLQMMRLGSDFANAFAQTKGDTAGSIFCLYGEDSAISEASSSGALDIGGALVVAAIAIPNLLKSKIAANEASAVGSLRTVTSAQIMYSSAYPKRGFAPNLARLGSDPNGNTTESPLHAGYIDASLAGPSCTADSWCTKSGYMFRVNAFCKEGNCTHFVAVATPSNDNSGSRNFCVTDDGVIRYQLGGPLTERVAIAECKKWAPLQ
ncbi:MAG TPA: hypothetical protein VN025_13785 [Candidatus Dormibacteraeota bacterium]|nr:hypothetical protein [Candidatus Dormibacteraeota bacterium]